MTFAGEEDLKNGGREENFFIDLPRQILALTKKNLLLAFRNRTATFLRILSSFFFILLIYLVNLALKGRYAQDPYFKDYPDPTRDLIDGIPACLPSNGVPCLTFVYAPAPDNTGRGFSPNATYLSLTDFSSSVGNCGSQLDCAEMFRVHRLVKAIMDGNMINGQPSPIPVKQVLGFRSQTDLDKYLYNNPNVVPAGYIFSAPLDRAATFVIQMNTTTEETRGVFLRPYLTVTLPMQVQAHRAIAQSTNPAIVMEIATQIFAHPAFVVSSFEGLVAPLFLLGCKWPERNIHDCISQSQSYS